MRLCINPTCQKPGNSDTHMFCQNCQSDLLIEGQYIVLRFIGEGGFGRIYAVKDQDCEKILKVLAQPDNAKAKNLFDIEKEILSDPDITGVPKLFEHFIYFSKNSDQAIPCIIMQKISGRNLEEWLDERNNRSISSRLALNWLKQIALTLDSVHKKDYFHRDIKPSNIMLDSDGNLVLIDFGISRKITNTLSEKIESGNVTQSHSPGYAPLEQEVGKASPQSDFFALGRTFIHLLTGQHPDNMAGLYRSANTDENWDWRSETQDCPELLLDFIDFLSDKSQNKRPKNTTELLQKIEALEENLFTSTKNQLSHDNNQFIKYKIQPGKPDILGSPIDRHSKRVTSLAISSDGKILISGSDDISIKIWDIASGKLVKTLSKPHQGSIHSVIISPNLDYFASGSNDKKICIWNYSDYTILQILAHPNTVNALAIDTKGKFLVSASADGYIRLWNATSTQPLQVYQKNSAAHSLTMTLNEQIIVSGHSDKKIIFWQCCEPGWLTKVITHMSQTVSSNSV